ncbi:hypothetical protein HK103_002377 [Boothiomyces macroporosus]|uniref:Uncharacterized protein n=1 Tax=Boothiomyces macroporosus TaxID=261099 RepID=A0AAD5UDA6_9FUNG|nr:hypothetical protein HK103_002377 [Boothiomyces macroporosus]
MDLKERLAATEREKEEAKRKLDRAEEKVNRAEEEMYQAKEEMYQAEAEYKAAKVELKALALKKVSDPSINKEYEELEKEVGELQDICKSKEHLFNTMTSTYNNLVTSYNKLLDIYNALIQRMKPSLTESERKSFYKVTGVITGLRKSGFCRSLYKTAQNWTGYYEKRGGETINPFSYQEKEMLFINVLFKNEENADQFRSTVLENVSIMSPRKDLQAQVSVLPVVDPEFNGTILVGDYVADEHSPPETPRESSISLVTNNDPLYKYQRLEADRYLLARPDRAHIIDKAECDKNSTYQKYRNDENNFLALSKDLHCFFDGMFNVDYPQFKLYIKHEAESTEPENDFRYRIDLIVEVYDINAAQAIFYRLKEGSTAIDDTHMETFVYVKNKDYFRTCLGWKAAKTQKAWDSEMESAVP